MTLVWEKVADIIKNQVAVSFGISDRLVSPVEQSGDFARYSSFHQ
jgi:hypothetical protein